VGAPSPPAGARRTGTDGPVRGFRWSDRAYGPDDEEQRGDVINFDTTGTTDTGTDGRTDHRGGVAVVGTTISAMSPRRVTVRWVLHPEPTEEWTDTFRHPSCAAIPGRYGVTTAYGMPLPADGGILWSVEESEVPAALAVVATLVDRANVASSLSLIG